MTPSCSPVDPMITRTSRARIRPFTRICSCRFSLLPARRECGASLLFHFRKSAVDWTRPRSTRQRCGCEDHIEGPAISRAGESCSHNERVARWI